MKNNSVQKIVIVGGGTAGLELATHLGRRVGKSGKAQITLLDTSSTHIWKPLLHELSAGTIDSSESVEYLSQAHRNHFIFRLGKMEGLNRAAKEIYISPTLSDAGSVLIPRQTLTYDTLVFAVGSVSNTFNISGVAEHCLFLDSTANAIQFQKHLVESYIRSHSQKGNTKPLTIAIIGAGATGVELAAELHQVTNLLAVYGLDESSNVKITIIEAANRVLPALPANIAITTAQQLIKLGIELKLDARVVEVSDKEILTESGDVFEAQIKVWTGGIKAPEWLHKLDGLHTNNLNQLIVDETLKTNDDAIFALGDCAACVWEEGVNVPPRAQAAHQQACVLAKSLVNRLNGGALSEFTYHDYGSLISLANYTVIGNLSSVNMAGFSAKFAYFMLCKTHQIAIHGYFRTAMLTLSNLFRRATHARIKMH